MPATNTGDSRVRSQIPAINTMTASISLGCEGARTTTVEEGVWLPSASARGECVLPVQVDRRRLSSGTQFIGATA